MVGAIANMLIRIHKSHLQIEFENKVSLHFKKWNYFRI